MFFFLFEWFSQWEIHYLANPRIYIITKNSDTLGVKPMVIWLKWGMMIPLDAFFLLAFGKVIDQIDHRSRLIIDQDWSRLFSACLDTHGSILIILAFPLPIASNFLNELVVFLHGVLPGPQYDSARGREWLWPRACDAAASPPSLVLWKIRRDPQNCS